MSLRVSGSFKKVSSIAQSSSLKNGSCEVLPFQKTIVESNSFEKPVIYGFIQMGQLERGQSNVWVNWLNLSVNLK